MASRWGHSPLMWPKKLSMGAWSVGVWGRPKCWAIEHSAMNALVASAVMGAPLSETANKIGVWPGSGSSPVSRRSSTAPMRFSASRASRNTAWVWVAVSSGDSRVEIHLRDTKSMMAKQFGAAPQRLKWVTS